MKKLLAVLAVLLLTGGIALARPALGAVVDTVGEAHGVVAGGGVKEEVAESTAVAAKRVAQAKKDWVVAAKDVLIDSSGELDYQQHHPEVLYGHTTKRAGPAMWIGFLLVWGVGIYLFWATALCRDLSYAPEQDQLRPVADRPYSYTRMQLWWWTMVILSCYVSFFLYTGVLAAFTPTMALLLGGGLAVSLFGKVMDNAQLAQNNDGAPYRHQDLGKTQGMLVDILSDEGGVTISRFQTVVFNVVFGIGFLVYFFRLVPAMAYPFHEFETWQLTLLGVSAAGFLGMKAGENSAATKEQRQVAAVKGAADGGVVPDVTASTRGSAGFVGKGLAGDGADEKATTPAFARMKAALLARGVM